MATVAVLGAGILGASTAFHLGQRGVKTVCIERRRPGGGTTAVSLARLSAFQQSSRPGFELSQTGIAEYHHLVDLFGAPSWWQPCGGIAWSGSGPGPAGGPDDDWFIRHVTRLRTWGYRADWYTAAQVRRLREPAISFPDSRTPVARFPQECLIDAPAVVRSLLSAAQKCWGLVYCRATAESLDIRHGRVTGVRLASGDRIAVDAVVNATGNQDMAENLGIPPADVVSRRGLVVDVATGQDLISHVLRAGGMNIRPTRAGLLRLRSNDVDTRLPGRTDADAARDPTAVEDLLRSAAQVLPALARARVKRVQVGTAYFPSDGLPSAGRLSALDGYYEILSNSGITRGPLLGRLMADLVVTGEADPMLAQCSPDRLRAHQPTPRPDAFPSNLTSASAP